MKNKLIIITICIILGLLPNLVMTVSAAQGDYIEFRANFVNKADKAGLYPGRYLYVTIASALKAKIIEGDYLQYDVRLETENKGTGGIDCMNIRWERMASFDIKDNFGVMIHPEGDLSKVAYKKWVTRKIIMDGEAIGKEMETWMLAYDDPDAVGYHCAKYRDIKLYDKSGNVKLVIYEGGYVEIDKLNLPFDSAHAEQWSLVGCTSTGQVYKDPTGKTPTQITPTVTVPSSSSLASTSTSSTAKTSSIVNSTSSKTSSINSQETSGTESTVESSMDIYSSGTSVKTTTSTKSTGNAKPIWPVIVVIAVTALVLAGCGVGVFFVLKKGNKQL